jgi:hypothetical protein
MKETKTKETKVLILIGVALSFMMITNGIVFFHGKKEQPAIWYVEKGLEDHWARVLRDAQPPGRLNEIRLWNEDAVPGETGILITTNHRERAEVYYRLSYDLQYEGAIVLAVDPWMVFRKHGDPELTADRVYAGKGADKAGVVLIPGKDPESVRAWMARLKDDKLFETNIFPRGAQTYNWQDVFHRLMGSETAWVYAPLSVIRRYPNFRKSILVAAPFPEQSANARSLQASLLWAIPLGCPEEQGKMGKIIAWLKKPETQTVIADNLDWIPADPYGKPYDPISLMSHRNWLTAEYIYEAAQ